MFDSHDQPHVRLPRPASACRRDGTAQNPISFFRRDLSMQEGWNCTESHFLFHAQSPVSFFRRDATAVLMFDSHGQPQHAGGMELPYSCSTATASLMFDCHGQPQNAGGMRGCHYRNHLRAQKQRFQWARSLSFQLCHRSTDTAIQSRRYKHDISTDIIFLQISYFYRYHISTDINLLSRSVRGGGEIGPN